MKEIKIERKRPYGRIIAGAAIGLVVIGVGVVIGYDKLRELYLEQCVITDMSAQVTIHAGMMVHPSNIAEQLGLKPGANLATIDFARKREELMREVPNIRSVTITRSLPDKVTVSVEERTPVARMGIRGNRAQTGKVVDTEGMVFIWQRGTQTLPTIREPLAPGTPKGQRIKGRTLAALRLIEACREPEFLELGVLEVDVSKPDFLVATLGNYSKAKILWEEMDEGTPASRSDLVRKLRMLLHAIRTKLATDAVIWNATLPNAVTGDTQKKL